MYNKKRRIMKVFNKIFRYHLQINFSRRNTSRWWTWCTSRFCFSLTWNFSKSIYIKLCTFFEFCINIYETIISCISGQCIGLIIIFVCFFPKPFWFSITVELKKKRWNLNKFLIENSTHFNSWNSTSSIGSAFSNFLIVSFKQLDRPETPGMFKVIFDDLLLLFFT